MSDDNSTGALDDLIGSLRVDRRAVSRDAPRAARQVPRQQRRQGRRLHSRAGQGRPELVRHLRRHRRRPDVRRRRLRAALQHPVGLEAVRVRPGARRPRPRRRAQESRRRADGRGVQRDRARRSLEPALQPAGERRRHRHGRPDPRQGLRRPHQADCSPCSAATSAARSTSTTRSSCPSGPPATATGRSRT